MRPGPDLQSLTFMNCIFPVLPPSPSAGVWADPSGGPGPEGDPPAGTWWRGFLGEHPAGRDLHPSEEAGPGSALGGLAPAGRGRLRLRPLTDRKQEAGDLKEEKKRSSQGQKTKGKSFQSKSHVADPPSVWGSLGLESSLKLQFNFTTRQSQTHLLA